jgi:hypothetical protein
MLEEKSGEHLFSWLRAVQTASFVCLWLAACITGTGTTYYWQRDRQEEGALRRKVGEEGLGRLVADPYPFEKQKPRAPWRLIIT